MSAEDDMHRACAELRFAEGLRRRSAEARAEASIREACGFARLEGAQVDPDHLRERVVAGVTGLGELPADLVVGLGAWRATWSVVSQLPALNERSRGPAGVGLTRPGLARQGFAGRPSMRSLAAGIQRDYGSLLVARGLCPSDQITMPLDPAQWGHILERIKGHGGTASATERAATAWALLVLEEPFPVGNRVMGALLAKFILAEQGVEPTAVSVITALATEKSGEYFGALNRVVAGEWEPWFDFFRRSVTRGCQAGQRIALQVQAGKLV